jgi:hypothetical protein
MFHDYKKCKGITEHQKEACYYWFDNDWQVRNEVEPTSPFGDGCVKYGFCEFDEADMVEDRFYVQCEKCATGWDPVFGPLNGMDAQFFGCSHSKEIGAGGFDIIIDCVKQATTSPTTSPTDSPTPSPTSAPTKGPGFGEKVKDDPKLLGGVLGGVGLVLAVVAFLVKKRADRLRRSMRSDSSFTERDSSSFDDDRRKLSSSSSRNITLKQESSGILGFEMINPMARKAPVEKSESKSWITKKDPTSGLTYYYNKLTKATTWTSPSELARRRASTNVVQAEWEKHIDPVTTYPYYLNVVTGESVWVAPKGCGDLQVTGMSSRNLFETVSRERSATNAPGARDAAEKMWTKRIDPASGFPYFVHIETGESVWETPAGAADLVVTTGESSDNAAAHAPAKTTVALAAMSIEQVGLLLEKQGLGKYKVLVEGNDIDGSLLEAVKSVEDLKDMETDELKFGAIHAKKLVRSIDDWRKNGVALSARNLM